MPKLVIKHLKNVLLFKNVVMFFSISTVVEKFRFSHRTQIKYLMEIMLKHFENVVITTLLLP